MFKGLYILAIGFLSWASFAATGAGSFVVIPSDKYSPRVMLVGKTEVRQEGKAKVPYTKYYACTFRITQKIEASGIKSYSPVIPDFGHLKPTSKKDFMWDASTHTACYLPLGDRYFHFTRSMAEALAKDERRAGAQFVIYATVFSVASYYASSFVLSSVNSWFLSLGASYIIRQVSVLSTASMLGDLELKTLRSLYAYDLKKTPFEASSPKLTLAYLVNEFSKHRHRWWSPSYQADMSQETEINTVNGQVHTKVMPDGANMVTFVMKLKQLLKFDNLRMSRREVAPGYWVYSYDNPFYK